MKRRSVFSTICFLISVATTSHLYGQGLVAAVASTENWTVQFPHVDSIELPRPTIGPNQSAAQRQENLKQLSGNAGWKRFCRDSAVAPVTIKMASIKDATGARIGHTLHTAFVVHADLATLKDDDLMKRLFSGEHDPANRNEAQQVADQDLENLGIQPDSDTHYSQAKISLLKKVSLRGVLQIRRTETDDGLMFRFEMDPRFNTENRSDGECQNAWSPLREPGLPWVCYRGFAGYLSIQALPEVPNACLIESRLVLHEPAEWFGGSGLLRSKLPLMIQEGVRSFRRKLKQ